MKSLIGCICILVGFAVGVYGLSLLINAPDCFGFRVVRQSLTFCGWAVYVSAGVITFAGFSTLLYGRRVWRGDE